MSAHLSHLRACRSAHRGCNVANLHRVIVIIAVDLDHKSFFGSQIMITKLSSEVTRCAQLGVFEKGVEQQQDGHGLSDDRSHSPDDPPGPGWGGIVEEHRHHGGYARSEAGVIRTMQGTKHWTLGAKLDTLPSLIISL